MRRGLPSQCIPPFPRSRGTARASRRSRARRRWGFCLPPRYAKREPSDGNPGRAAAVERHLPRPLNTAVVAAIPNAMVITATALNSGPPSNARRACRRSAQKDFIIPSEPADPRDRKRTPPTPASVSMCSVRRLLPNHPWIARLRRLRPPESQQVGAVSLSKHPWVRPEQQRDQLARLLSVHPIAGSCARAAATSDSSLQTSNASTCLARGVAR